MKRKTPVGASPDLAKWKRSYMRVFSKSTFSKWPYLHSWSEYRKGPVSQLDVFVRARENQQFYSLRYAELYFNAMQRLRSTWGGRLAKILRFFQNVKLPRSVSPTEGYRNQIKFSRTTFQCSYAVSNCWDNTAGYILKN